MFDSPTHLAPAPPSGRCGHAIIACHHLSVGQLLRGTGFAPAILERMVVHGLGLQLFVHLMSVRVANYFFVVIVSINDFDPADKVVVRIHHKALFIHTQSLSLWVHIFPFLVFKSVLHVLKILGFHEFSAHWMCHGRISISFFQNVWVAHASVKRSTCIHCYATFTIFYSKLFVTLLGKAFFQYALIWTEAVCVAILNLKNY